MSLHYAAEPRNGSTLMPLSLFQIVGPVSHHLGARLQIEGMVVSGADGIAGSVRKLQLDVIVVLSLFMQDRRSHAPEAVAGHAAFETHPLQCFQDGVVAHGLIRVAVAGKKPFAFAGERS